MTSVIREKHEGLKNTLGRTQYGWHGVLVTSRGNHNLPKFMGKVRRPSKYLGNNYISTHSVCARMNEILKPYGNNSEFVRLFRLENYLSVCEQAVSL